MPSRHAIIAREDTRCVSLTPSCADPQDGERSLIPKREIEVSAPKDIDGRHMLERSLQQAQAARAGTISDLDSFYKNCL
jgi:hypothetical protein